MPAGDPRTAPFAWRVRRRCSSRWARRSSEAAFCSSRACRNARSVCNDVTPSAPHTPKGGAARLSHQVTTSTSSWVPAQACSSEPVHLAGVLLKRTSHIRHTRYIRYTRRPAPASPSRDAYTLHPLHTEARACLSLARRSVASSRDWRRALCNASCRACSSCTIAAFCERCRGARCVS